MAGAPAGAGEIDPALAPLFLPDRHTRDEVKGALALVMAMDHRQRRRLADAIDDAPLAPAHREVLFRVLGPTPAGWR
jgi:hypothetical protein